MTVLTLSHESCEAVVLMEGKGIASIQGIGSIEQGKGHAQILIKKIETVAKNKKCSEIWYPTVIHPALEHILSKNGYKYVSFGIHPMIGGEVFGYKKILKS